MSTVWTQRREELLSDCIVSPEVFHQMVDRLGEFIAPYQHALGVPGASAGKCTVRLLEDMAQRLRVCTGLKIERGDRLLRAALRKIGAIRNHMGKR